MGILHCLPQNHPHKPLILYSLRALGFSRAWNKNSRSRIEQDQTSDTPFPMVTFRQLGKASEQVRWCAKASGIPDDVFVRALRYRKACTNTNRVDTRFRYPVDGPGPGRLDLNEDRARHPRRLDRRGREMDSLRWVDEAKVAGSGYQIVTNAEDRFRRDRRIQTSWVRHNRRLLLEHYISTLFRLLPSSNPRNPKPVAPCFPMLPPIADGFPWFSLFRVS